MVFIKNKVFQPIAIVDKYGKTVVLKSREKKEVDVDIDNLPKVVKDFETAEMIKIS